MPPLRNSIIGCVHHFWISHPVLDLLQTTTERAKNLAESWSSQSRHVFEEDDFGLQYFREAYRTENQSSTVITFVFKTLAAKRLTRSANYQQIEISVAEQFRFDLRGGNAPHIFFIQP